MDTDGQLPERDRSPAPDEGEEQRSRSSRSAAAACAAWWREGGALRRAGALVACCVVLTMLVSAYVVQPFLIPSGSMENTLRIGDRVLVNKLAYRFGNEPRRGDVIVFDGTGSFVHDGTSGDPLTGLLREAGTAVGLVEPEETDYVKRVIGVGGDRVTCCDSRGRIKVNGKPLDEDYLSPGDSPSRVPFDIAVPRGRLWVMGDHRSDSRDSRDHLGEPGGGTVPVDKVIGRADWIGWPYRHWTSLGRPGTFAGVPAPSAYGTGGARG